MLDILLIVFLSLLNGIFAASEMAVVSARRVRLQQWADDGYPGAASALDLQNHPKTFLSTVQVGVTGITILTGALGESTVAEHLAVYLKDWGMLEKYARPVSIAVAVTFITYISVVLGELVPKRLALHAPERFAAFIARPMRWIAKVTNPFVRLLTFSSDTVLKLFRLKSSEEPPVTDEEIKVLMEQGAEAGVFHESEQAIVSNVLRLDEQRVGAIMTHRTDINFVDLNDPEESNRIKVAQCPHSRLVVCRDGLEHVLGILHTGDLLKKTLANARVTFADDLRPPLYVPETVTTSQLLESFRKGKAELALVVDEYGDLKGLVTLTDVLGAIVGDVPSEDAGEAQDAVKRPDGSWLIDGMISVDRFKEILEVNALEGEEDGVFNTVAGFVMAKLSRVPVVGDRFESGELTVEVVDMDKRRVDRLLVKKREEPVVESEA
jgi:putative hemolysin